MIKKLSHYMNGYWKYVIIGTLAMITEVACELILPSLMANIVDEGIVNKDMDIIVKNGIIMIIVALIGMTGGITCARFSAKSAMGFGAKVRNDMFAKISSFSFKNIDTFSTASLTTRMTNDVTNLQNTIMMSLRILVRAPAMLVIAAVFAFSIDAKLSSVLLIALPIILIFVGVVMKIGYPLFSKMQKRIDSLNSTVQENLIGMRVVKAFVREEHEKEKFKKANDNLMKIGFKASSIIVLTMPMMMLLFNVIIMLLIWNGGARINAGNMGTGELFSLISYVMQILMSIIMVAMILIMVVRSKASGERIIEVLETDVDIKNAEETVAPALVGKVEFKNVNFRYSTQTSGDDILSNINFTAEPGEFVAVIGGTGSGKSSLVNLIPRLYDVTGGQVLVDGVDVRDYDLKHLRDEIGVVLQKNTLFSGTIKENLLWGKKDATDEEIIEACKAASAHDFIMAQPEGYDTYLSQGGLNLSGGQKQRLCIARAMIGKPKIIILDDSTSAVDTATEANIRRSFSTLLKGTTVFMIAQRISSIAHADKIIVLNDGQISAIGTHEELLKTSEIYQEINATQQKGVLS